MQPELRDLIDRYSLPVPRYTSYPTAPHFHGGIGADTYARWLGSVAAGATMSLYLHIPYCDRLCWFCGCHTKHTLRYEPVAEYLKALHAEIDWVSAKLGGRGRVTAIHLGGGSPTLLTPEDLLALKAKLSTAFSLDANVQISVEIDPNDLDDGRYDAMATFGLTRASIGVQDFDPKVQKAINRIQSLEQTRAVVDAMRQRGIASVNLDLLYGLPFQTEDGLARTIGAALELAPDRVALFGYAHVPWMKPHQKMIPEEALPDRFARFGQAMLAGEMLAQAGLEPIGFDHFARPDDPLAIAAHEGRLRRNFQGYTDDAADVLIGLGASAIGQLPQGYVQNITPTGDYSKTVLAGSGATAKGFALTPADKMRARAIAALLCNFRLGEQDLAGFGAAATALLGEAEAIALTDADGMTEMRDGAFVVTERGRPFVRTIAARFDSYFGTGTARHSAAV
ncbi:oxygen-independent coproporphyrinogen III oxidase [Devosia sp. XJ19-1]|uniref:Coproporphyrinogen-III oxidase n=1 Tax=Devosia ureilytica TaxID=2952754 RepID=A0A9Q4FTU8_9HYPH|nr:oxygen-independent coproporphyrinogen III oxidase [Devosia ureilytica]MCP8884461.1 oxygen-independent coproporphyrinogen III oxidase [Devosia ureilytica]MCP8888069.1 oxygen-independent coproporphyrinogen III oxidase [Devosia ureilytica]